MDVVIPVWLALVFMVAGMVAMTIGYGLLTLWQNANFGTELKRREDAVFAKLREQSQHCQSEINLLSQALAHRDEQLQELQQQLQQHESFLINLGRLGIGNFTINAGKDITVGGDVAGRDKVQA